MYKKHARVTGQIMVLDPLNFKWLMKRILLKIQIRCIYMRSSDKMYLCEVITEVGKKDTYGKYTELREDKGWGQNVT